MVWYRATTRRCVIGNTELSLLITEALKWHHGYVVNDILDHTLDRHTRHQYNLLDEHALQVHTGNSLTYNPVLIDKFAGTVMQVMVQVQCIEIALLSYVYLCICLSILISGVYISVCLVVLCYVIFLMNFLFLCCSYCANRRKDF